MVPNSWMSCHLGDFMEFKNGLNADKSQYGYGLKFVNVMDVFGNDILTEDKIIGRVNVAESQLESNLLKFGDVLFNRTSETFDEIAMSAVYLDDKPAVFGGFVIRARPSNGILSPAYSVYLFQSSKFRNQVIKLGQGAVRANIGQKDLAKVKVSLPPLPEQKKIAQILSTWDKAITVTEKLLANSQQQKKALMQQLLTGKKRLLDKNGVRFGGEWKTTTISKFIKESRVAGSSGDTAKKLTVKLYGNGVVAKEEKRIGSESTKYYRRSAGQFIYSKLDFLNGAFGIIPNHLDGYESTLDVPAFDFLDGVCIQWFLYFVTRKEFYTANLGLANGGRKARRVNPSDLLKVRMPTPSPEEQQKIAAVLSAADQEIAALQKKLDALKQEKKALMQQLLTGKRRVKI